MRRTHTRVMEDGQGKAPLGSGESTPYTGNFVVLRDLHVTVIRLRTQPNFVRSANEWSKQLRFMAQKYWIFGGSSSPDCNSEPTSSISLTGHLSTNRAWFSVIRHLAKCSRRCRPGRSSGG
jgi:hypothetical protein